MILRPILVVVSLVLLVFLAGCAANTPKPFMLERDGIDAVVLTDDLKVSYIKQHGHIDRICASRDADAVATDESGISLGFSMMGKSESLGEQSGRGELGLGGRSPVVLIAREYLYRACEVTNNLNSNEEKTIEIYKMFLESLERIAQSRIAGGGTQAVSSSMPAYSLTAPAAARGDGQKGMSDDGGEDEEGDDDDEDGDKEEE